MTMSERAAPANPYFYGGPIKDPNNFFGYEEQLQTVFERLSKGGSTSLIGQRRSGKTSFLYYLMTSAAHRACSFDVQDFIFVYMDPELGIKDAAGFYREVIEAVAGRVPALAAEACGEVSERQVIAALKKLQPRRLVLLLDEFQALSSAGDFPPEFFRFLRGLVRYEVCFITATMENLYDCCPPEVVSSPFPGLFAAVYLAAWTESEFSHFLAETSQPSGAPIVAHKDEILELAGRFPFYVQMACSFYFDLWRKQGKITAEDHRIVKDRFAEQARPYFERVWKSYLTVPEKVTLVALAHGRAPSDSVSLRNLVQKGYVLDNRSFSSALADFVLRKEAEEEEIPPAQSIAVSGGPAARSVWVDKKSGDVWVGGKRVPPLTNLEYKLLLCLYDNANCICDKYSIVEAVWSGDYIEQVDDSRIAKLVSRLRECVEPDLANPRYIQTVHGRGYKLVIEDT